MSNEPERLFRVVDKESQFYGRVYVRRSDESDREYIRADLVATAQQDQRKAMFTKAIATVQSVSNDSDLDDGGFFEAGFIAARTRIIDALLKAATPEEKKGE